VHYPDFGKSTHRERQRLNAMAVLIGRKQIGTRVIAGATNFTSVYNTIKETAPTCTAR
jgi:hypothetical protein